MSGGRKRVSARASSLPPKPARRAGKRGATGQADEAVAGRAPAKKKAPSKKKATAKKASASKKKPAAKRQEAAQAVAPAKKKASARKRKPATKARSATKKKKAPAPERAATPEVIAEEVRAAPRRRGPSVPPPLPAGDLGNLLSEVDGAGDSEDARARAADAIGRIAARLYPESETPAEDEGDLLANARQLLSTDYYLRQWGRLGMRGRSERVDDFGLDRTYEARVQPTLDALYERYFRVEIAGVEHLPAEGPALLVANHGGTLPWDGVMLKTAIQRNHAQGRGLRWLIEDYAFHQPFLGAFLNRIGAVRACPENAERLLAQGELLAVFPEGVKGVEKTYAERYKLQRFGRGGHVKLALRMGVPLIPVAIVGAEETHPLLHRTRAFSKALGLPFIPITPTFPLLGPLGLLPLPSRWRIAIGPTIRELEGLDASVAEDTLRVNELNERVRSGVQHLLHQALEARGPNAFFKGHAG
ncbi:MAG: lysophospholipid acyltransferase family protein [Myxococcales bacterium]|nr:lysophospholipid acyltransferase family protein [Myxococcales bacterium]